VTAVMGRDIHVGDALPMHDWAGEKSLHIASVVEGDWTDHDGLQCHGMVVVTRELGPLYAMHFGLAQIVEVTR
jgi:hypothetical protein